MDCTTRSETGSGSWEGFETTGNGSTRSRILAVASIFLAAGLIALLRLDDKLSSCFLFTYGLLEQFLSQFGEVKCA